MSGRGVPPSVAVLRTDRDALQGLEGSNLRINPRTSAGATRAAVGRPPRPDRQRLSSCWIRLVWWTEADDHEGCSLWPSRLPPCQRPRPKVSPVRTVHRVAVVHPPGLRTHSRLLAYSASRNPALLGRESAVGLTANGASSSPENPGPSCQNLRASSACPSVKVRGSGLSVQAERPNPTCAARPPQSQGSPSPQQQRRQGASLPE